MLAAFYPQYDALVLPSQVAFRSLSYLSLQRPFTDKSKCAGRENSERALKPVSTYRRQAQRHRSAWRIPPRHNYQFENLPGHRKQFQVTFPPNTIPAKPACLLLKLDGLGSFEGTVLDNLIAKKEVPVIIGVGVSSGTAWKDPAGTPSRRAFRFNRSFEFDSVNDRFPEFVLNELLPAVQKLTTQDGRAIELSPDGNDHAATGGSTGGIGSFTLAWRRPDQFTRVYSVIGTFVSMRGGNEYSALVRKTDPKPIRIFLEDGSSDAWNPLFGSWFDANINMESALTLRAMTSPTPGALTGTTVDQAK